MNRDGRLFGAVSGHFSARQIKIHGGLVNGNSQQQSLLLHNYVFPLMRLILEATGGLV